MFRIRNSSFWLVFTSFVLPSASLVLTIYALSFFLLEYFADSPELISYAELLNTLPVLLGFLFIGLAVDRFHRKHLAVVSLLLRLLFSALAMLFLYYDFIVATFAMLFARMFFHKLFATMEMAIIQGLLQEHEYVQAASLKQLINGILALSGSFIALFIYRKFGMTGIMAIDCLFTLLATLFISRARIPLAACLPNGRHQHHRLRQSLVTFWTETKLGIRYVWSSWTFRSILFIYMVFGIANAFIATLPLYSLRFVLADGVETYQQYAATFSFMLGLAFALGSLGYSLIGKALHPGKTVKTTLILLPMLFLTLGFIHHAMLFFTIVFIIGLTIVILNVTIGAWLPKIVAPAYMGRTYALLDPASLSMKSMALLLCGWLYPKLLTLPMMYVLFSLLIAIGAAIVWRFITYDHA